MPIDPPGGGEDPRIRRLDGETFQFAGVAGRRYRLLDYRRPDGRSLAIHPRVAALPNEVPGQTCFSGVDIHVSTPAHIYLDTRGVLHVFADGQHLAIELKVCTLDAPGHGGHSTNEPHPLQGVPHINIDLSRLDLPADATGLVVDGSADADPRRYEVPG